jgi:hypothetical protein
MIFAYMLSLRDGPGQHIRLIKPVELTAIPRTGDWVDTGSSQLGKQQVVSVAWHLTTGGVDLGQFTTDDILLAELQHAGWRIAEHP